jgi:hypothetical protein
MDAGTDWVGRLYGTALDFDGSNDFVSLPRLIASNEFSWSLFTYPTSIPSNGAVGIFGSGGNDADQVIWISNTAFVGFGIVSYVSPVAVNVASQQSLPSVNQFYHVCGVRSLQINRLLLFVNGVEVASVLLSQTAAAFGTTQDWRIGSRAAVQYYTGRVDDVRYYNRALTQAEIRLLASEPGIGLRPERTSLYFADAISSRRRKILTGLA